MDPRLMIGSRSPQLRNISNTTNNSGYSSQKTNNQKNFSCVLFKDKIEGHKK